MKSAIHTSRRPHVCNAFVLRRCFRQSSSTFRHQQVTALPLMCPSCEGDLRLCQNSTPEKATCRRSRCCGISRGTRSSPTPRQCLCYSPLIHDRCLVSSPQQFRHRLRYVYRDPADMSPRLWHQRQLRPHGLRLLFIRALPGVCLRLRRQHYMSRSASSAQQRGLACTLPDGRSSISSNPVFVLFCPTWPR